LTSYPQAAAARPTRGAATLALALFVLLPAATSVFL